jgi:hypothetical protein
MDIEGFHGTDAANVNGIVDNGFRLSLGDEEWLGDGVYFFVDGITSNPQSNATKWSIANAWDNNLKKYTYLNYAVIKTIIKVNEANFLDLTTTEGMKVFNYLRNKYVSKIIANGKRLNAKNADFKDGHLINNARKKFNFQIDAVKGNFYIKFTNERIHNINFRVPNTTIVAVYDTDNCLEKKYIEVLKVKKIEL